MNTQGSRLQWQLLENPTYPSFTVSVCLSFLHHFLIALSQGSGTQPMLATDRKCIATWNLFKEEIHQCLFIMDLSNSYLTPKLNDLFINKYLQIISSQYFVIKNWLLVIQRSIVRVNHKVNMTFQYDFVTWSSDSRKFFKNMFCVGIFVHDILES